MPGEDLARVMTLVRLVRFTLDPAAAAKVAEALATELVPRIREQPGCPGATLLGDAASGEHGLFVQWASKEQAEAAAAVIGPRLGAMLQGNVKAAPEMRLYPVLS